ncbi:hypothetical protein [Coralloluteibacterium thermophilus]|uniref:DNA transfer protein p32 n=1 Tax=Coralloluteibacterium thermophilum TaxID=2707049 RepID=A0ABV9NMY1_9GAMM
MAAVTGAAIGAATTLYSTNQAKKSAQGAANAQVGASNAAIAEQQRQFDLARQDQMPWLQAGQTALSSLERLNSGDYSGFENSPDYLYAQDRGLAALDRSAAARGSLYAGGTDADRISFASGLATQNLNNYRNSLNSMAGLGQTTASNLGSLGQSAANNVSNALINAGNARASSYQAAGQANQNAASGLAGLAGWGIGQYQKGNAWNWGGNS